MNFIQALVVILLLTVLRAIMKSVFLGYYYSNVGNAIASILTLGSVILICTRYFSKRNIQLFPTTPVNDRAFVLVASTTLFLFLATTVLGRFEELLRNGANEFFNGDFVFGWSSRMTRYFLGALLVAPILEEFFFNGILLQGFLKKYKPVTSVVLNTLLFTSFHLSKGDVSNWNFVMMDKISIALSGAFTAWVMIQTSNIKLTIFLHFFWNALNYLFPFLISAFGIELTNPTAFFIFSTVVLLLSVAMLIRNFLRLRSGAIFTQ